jgi:hypothetical protein
MSCAIPLAPILPAAAISLALFEDLNPLTGTLGWPNNIKVVSKAKLFQQEKCRLQQQNRYFVGLLIHSPPHGHQG